MSLAAKLERVALKLLCRLASIGFPRDFESTTSEEQNTFGYILREILSEGRCSPRSAETAASVISFLMADWRSGDILINNRLSSSFRDALRKLGPELSELLSMWDGDYELAQWLLTCGQDAAATVWDEVLSRVEFWLLREHSRYTLKWLTILRTLLARSTERRIALINLEGVLAEQDADMSFEKWIGRVSAMLPESESEAFDEIASICALSLEASVSNEMSMGNPLLNQLQS